MNRLELAEKILDLKEQVRQAIELGESESRELNEEETNHLAELRQEIADAEAEIARLDEEDRKLANEENKNNKESKTNCKMKEIRLVDLIRDIANGVPVQEEARHMVTGNKINLRADIVAGVDANGGYNVPEDKMGLDVAIRNASVLNRMGAAWMRMSDMITHLCITQQLF